MKDRPATRRRLRMRAESLPPRALHSETAATANASRGARAEPAAQANGSRLSGLAIGGDPVQEATNFVLELVCGGAINLEIGADRIADRTMGRPARREIADQKRLSLSAECLDPLE